jgi:hypothetical protein
VRGQKLQRRFAPTPGRSQRNREPKCNEVTGRVVRNIHATDIRAKSRSPGVAGLDYQERVIVLSGASEPIC